MSIYRGHLPITELLDLNVGCIRPLFGIDCLNLMWHSLIHSCEAKTKSDRKSIQIHTKLIDGSPYSGLNYFFLKIFLFCFVNSGKVSIFAHSSK